MNKELKYAFQQEMTTAKAHYCQGEFKKCFYHLERAHILGQSFVIPHTIAHWWMLKLGMKTADVKEISGQILRIIASVIFSRIWVPKGNTGGVNVSPIKPMPLPEEFKKYFN